MASFSNPPRSSHRLFRPPAEGDSLILRVADGCPHNACAFCAMYKGVPYRVLTPPEMAREVAQAQAEWPEAGRIFLADGDVMALPFATLCGLLDELNARFPRLARIGTYANGSSILAKSEAELRALRERKLHTLYLGLESGDDATLQRMHKAETATGMTDAVRRAQACGLRLSVMILIGVAGREQSAVHATATATVLNRMQPRLLSALRCVPIPGTALHAEIAAGRFQPLTEHEAVAELRAVLAGLELAGTVFRANHASNSVPLEGRLPKDRDMLLAGLDLLLASNALDRRTSGPVPWSL